MTRKDLEEQYGEVWNTDQATEKFEFTAFQAPFAIVKDKTSEKKGVVAFQHMPRYYFDFRETP